MTLEPPPEYPNARHLALRKALGTFPSGVCVVTTEGEDGPVGITINSFTSVSLAPPLVLWCLDERSGRWPVFVAATHFRVHVLAAGEQALAHRYARGAARLVDGDQAFLADRSLAVFECRVHQQVQTGDHMIIIGDVQSFQDRPGSALTFHRGKYGSLEGGSE
ncbi:MAG: flavin reductase family protein [Brevundimonas sp.]|nr:MAG: flavin reductase family protein [Brevundimonas sp.]